MKEITLTVKTITPTLMGGAFSQNDGIRPSEIKGMMRYWFRAVAGLIINNLSDLKFLEGKVFGSQDQKSPFRIIVESLESNLENLKWNKLDYGVKYLGFVINLNQHRQENVLLENSKFDIKFLFKNSYKQNLINIVIYSFYIATALGGFGLRARRGFGSWQIEKVDNSFTNFLKLGNYEPDNIKDIINELKKEIEKLAQDYSKENKIQNERNTDFKTIDKDFIIKHSLEGKSWEEALDFLGKKYKDYRNKNQKTTIEYRNIKCYLINECKWPEDCEFNWNFAFGLPIQLNSKGNYHNSIKKIVNSQEKFLNVGMFKVKHKEKYLERLPSSVWFSVKQSKDGKYFVILTYLEGKIFPDEKEDKVVFEFNKKLNLSHLCEKAPKHIEIEYKSNDLKQRAKNFVKNFK